MPKKILVVDDEADLVDIYSEELTSLGYQTLPAYDGLQGYELALKENPDVIISDINMPKLDGLKMLEKLGQAGIRIPVIFVTAYSDTRKIQQAWKLGAFEFLEKPVDMAKMGMLVKNALEIGINLSSTQAAKPAPRFINVPLQLPEDLVNQLSAQAKQMKLTLPAYIEKKLTSLT